MNLIWRKDETILKDAETDSSLVFPVAYPGISGTAQKITLATSAFREMTLLNLVNVRLFLQGDAAQLDTLLNVWPNYGSQSNPPRPDLDGGVEISFDLGVTFKRLGALPDGSRVGFPADSSTWITVPAICITPGTVDGVLGPFDLATLVVRYVIPPLADQFQIFKVRLEAAFDVV